MDDAPINEPTNQDDGAVPAGDDQSFTPPAPVEPTGDDGAAPAGEDAPVEGGEAPEAPEAPEVPAEGGEEAAPAGDDSTPSDPAVL